MIRPLSLLLLGLAGCAAQLNASFGTGPHCYTGGAGERRCFDSEAEMQADYRHWQQIQIDRYKREEEKRAEAAERLENRQDAIEEAQIRQHRLDKQYATPSQSEEQPPAPQTPPDP